MAILIEEKPANTSTLGENSRKERHYYVRATAGETEDQATFALQAYTTAVMALDATHWVVRKNVSLTELYDRDGDHAWEGTVEYGPITSPEQKPGASLRFSFNTTGGRATIKQAREVKATHVNPAYAPFIASSPPLHFNGAINFDGSQTNGVEIIVPQLSFAVHFKVPVTVITLGYVFTLAYLTGKMNHNFFLGFAPAELLFLGCNGGQIDDDWYELTYDFAASPNFQGNVGPFTNITKRGHDYAWVYYWPTQDDDHHVLVPDPAILNIVRVYDEADLTQLGFGA